MQIWKSRTAARVIPVVGLVLSSFLQFVPMGAQADFKSAYIRLDRMKINTATGGTICAKPSTASAGVAKVIITFPSTYTVNTTAANWTVSTTNLPAGSTAWPSIATASSATSPANVVTFGSGDLTSSTTLYCFNFSGTNTLTTAAGAATSQQASVETQTSGSATLDHSDIALSNITDDQIVVTAVVPPTFIFTLSGNTDTFSSNLDPASIKSTAGRTVTVTTNAKGGWIAWAKDTQQGLRSTSASYTIPTAGTIDGAPSTLTSGTEGYVLDTDLTTDAAGGCTLAIDAEYNGTTTSAGGTLSANFQPIAACTGASPATANGDVITLIERAAISGATPAGSDYTDTITVVGAGNF
ncbi:MAG TPA: hypothetical protein VI322_01785 [Candidatus Saccharimonadia bacterium]